MDNLLLKYYCNKSGMTLSELAEKLGINYVTLNRKMNGSSDFTRQEIIDIKELLNLDSEQANKVFF